MKVFLVLVAFVGGLAFANPAAVASDVGQCNSIAGESLGIAHRLNVGVGDTIELCTALGANFAEFGAAGCIPLLQGNDPSDPAEGDLFLNKAVGQYELACDVFCNICGADAQSFGICPFEVCD